MCKKNKQILYRLSLYLRVILGGAVYAVGIEWLFRPVAMISGGVTGISMIINMLTSLPVGVLIITINIPLFIIAFKMFGFRFMLGSLVGMLSSSIAIDLLSLIPFEPITLDPLLAAIYGGIVTGLGSGMMFAAGASSGGVDVIAKIYRRKYPYINFGTFILVLDFFVITAYALIFKRYENAMYTILAVFVASKVIDLALYGVSNSKLCYIISESSEEIKAEIVQTLHRGVTVIEGRGAYSNLPKQVLLCVIKRQQIVQIKKLIRCIDQQAFVVVSDARDVFGRGFGNISSDD